MAKDLRGMQRRVAREAILTAAADEIVERGLEQVSLQSVAARAGVSDRTLYNYFPNREQLWTGLCDWSDQLTLDLGGYLLPDDLDQLPAMVLAVWRTWQAQGNVYLATLAIASGTARSADRNTRHQALANALRKVRPDLDQDRAAELASVLHLLASPAAYGRLVVEDGLATDRAGQLVGWVLGLVAQAVSDGDDSWLPTDPDSHT